MAKLQTETKGFQSFHYHHIDDNNNTNSARLLLSFTNGNENNIQRKRK